MEQYAASSSSSTEQIVVQAGQIQQQQQGAVTAVQLQTEAQVASASGQQVQTLQVVVSSLVLAQLGSGALSCSSHCPARQQAGQGQLGPGSWAADISLLGVIQLVQPGQIQIQGGQAVQVQGQQGQTQQIIIQQPQTAVTAGQTQGPALQRCSCCVHAEGRGPGTNAAPSPLCSALLCPGGVSSVTVPVTGMITIPAASLAGAQIVQTGASTNTSSSGQGTVTVTLPVAGHVLNPGGLVRV
ncbi:Nuclear transcription factor Y subunit alpha, partial [Dryobates pubescens]